MSAEEERPVEVAEAGGDEQPAPEPAAEPQQEDAAPAEEAPKNDPPAGDNENDREQAEAQVPQEEEKGNVRASKLWKCDAVGSIANLTCRDVTIGAPKEGEVQIAVKSIGLNFADVYACKGLYAAAPKEDFTPGFEVSGTVTEVNYGADEKEKEDAVQPGDRVFALLRFGGYTTHVNIDHRYVRKFPNDWSLAQAAAFPVQSMTAYYALVVLGNLEKDMTVLIHSAAGGVGQNAIKICETVGAKVIATIGSPNKKKLLMEQLGLSEDQIIVRASTGKEFEAQFNQTLEKLEVDGVDIVCDSLLGDYFFPVFKKLLPMGRHIILGAASLTTQGDKPSWFSLGYKYLMRPKLDLLPLIGQNRSVMGFNLVYLFNKTEKVNEYYTDLMNMGISAPHVGEEFDFSQAPDALRRFQTGKTVGKVVLNTDN